MKADLGVGYNAFLTKAIKQLNKNTPGNDFLKKTKVYFKMCSIGSPCLVTTIWISNLVVKQNGS